MARASKSRRAVRSDTSSARATSAAVSCSRCGSSRRMAISRAARTPATHPQETGHGVTCFGRHDGSERQRGHAMCDPTDFPEPTLVSVNGVELEVFEAGRENAGKPIVLCHGWPEHAFSWRHQVPALVAAGYHVIVPNQRGFGNSSRPAEVTANDIAQLTGDLVGLLDHFGYDAATFAGHDRGAMVVWSLALLQPTQVRQV